MQPIPYEVCEVAPVLWVYVNHVPLEVLAADLYLPLQNGFIAGILLGPRRSGLCLCVEAVSG